MAKFHKRHYEILAKVINTALKDASDQDRKGINDFKINLAEELQDNNPNFQPERFFAACNQNIKFN